MPYIGSEPNTGLFVELDSLTASATANYTLQLNGADYFPETVNNLLVSINGVIQGSSTMALNGSTLTVGATLSSSDVIDFVRVFGNVGSISTPTDGSVTANKIGSGAVDLTTKVTGVLPVANGGTGNSIGTTTNYVTNQTVSGSSTQTEFECNLTGTALNGGAKTLRIYLTELSNQGNVYMHFRIKSADGYTDGGYAAAFAFNSGSSFNSNGNTDANQNNAMALGYYVGTYNIVIDCFLVDPSTNRWIMDGRSMSKDTTTAVHGNSIADNALGASKPITGFKFSSASPNGLGVANIKYGYSYTT